MTRYILLLWVLAGCGGGDGSGDEDDGSGGGGGGGGPCSCNASGVAADVQQAIATTCTIEVDCGVTTCDTCVSTYVDGYRASDSYTQAEYAGALECLADLSCSEWQAEDYSRCTGNSCGGIYCGYDNSVCAYYGCGSCGGDGYCH